MTLDRQYVKEILGSIGAGQPSTDRDRAQIALAYRCVSLTDIFWVRRRGEKISFQEINLYDNHLSNAFVDVSLRGRQMTVQNRELAQDLSTGGCFPKAWVRTEKGFRLLKGGGDGAVCQTVFPRKMSQKDAAVEAVKKAGLNQQRQVEPAWFDGYAREYAMFCRRLDVLERSCRQ